MTETQHELPGVVPGAGSEFARGDSATAPPNTPTDTPLARRPRSIHSNESHHRNVRPRVSRRHPRADADVRTAEWRVQLPARHRARARRRTHHRVRAS